jgi:hypothetical protein
MGAESNNDRAACPLAQLAIGTSDVVPLLCGTNDSLSSLRSVKCGGGVFWHNRHNRPRIGRVLIARGRDAADVPFLRSFGDHQLTGFRVITEELTTPGSPCP